METKLTRREVLSKSTVLLLVPIAGSAVACSSSNNSSSSSVIQASEDASACNGIFEISTVTNNHDHSLCVLTTDLTDPAAAGVTYTTSFNDGHAHTVSLTQAQLQSIEAGTAVTVTTSSPYAHNFTISKA
ncbi:MAG: hypothetical protein ACLQVI_43355 [Polyangiaceae bacterium]|jgi:hypothetical protein